MAILTGDLRFDLASIQVYLQLMASLGVGELEITDPETRQFITGVGEMLSRETDEVLRLGPAIIEASMVLVDRCIGLLPPLDTWYVIAADFSTLCKNDKEIYSFGIEFSWLFDRFDCSASAFSDLPLHARIGLGHHSGRASVEEQFLLGDAFFQLASAEQSQKLLLSYRELFTGDIESASTRLSLYSLNQNVATYSRMCVVSFLAFMETFVNGIAADYRTRNLSTLAPSEDEALLGKKKGSYLSLETKLEVVPGIISSGSSKLRVRDPAQRVEPFRTLIEIMKPQRDSSVHYAPGKNPIWKRPHVWVATAKECSEVVTSAAKEFWCACYPALDFPIYMERLDYDVLMEAGSKRVALQRSAQTLPAMEAGKGTKP